MRLEQENDNLAHELVTTKVELHSKLAEVCWCHIMHILCEMPTFDVFASEFSDCLVKIGSSSDIYERLRN